MYSDTDSIYFRVNPDLNWTNRQINEQMKKIEEIHCHDTKIGMSKFETSDDVGDCLEEYNQVIADGDEPLEYPFADEIVCLALKSYAIRSTHKTGKTMIRGKGIPQWMISGSGDDKRCKWNNNEKQFVFEDFIKCAELNKPFEYNVTQFSVRKANMLDDTK